MKMEDGLLFHLLAKNRFQTVRSSQPLIHGEKKVEQVTEMDGRNSNRLQMRRTLLWIIRMRRHRLLKFVFHFKLQRLLHNIKMKSSQKLVRLIRTRGRISLGRRAEI